MTEKLIDCKTCGHKIALSASKCPNCGANNFHINTGCALYSFIIIAISFSLLLLCTPSKKGNNQEVFSCTSRGIDYFKSIGSYPTLGNGKDAYSVAKERCQRTTTAF
ncbi:hypothetical protein [Halobacteriovorax sp. YZS-1-1]|uniref:hypothetical protein n=1 Tax=unclassified Halobacteriovorax TaxID=2639665 RepID=UPI00399B0489